MAAMALDIFQNVETTPVQWDEGVQQPFCSPHPDL